MEAVREDVRVAVIFGPGTRMQPVWFDWRRRRYNVTEVTYTWQERRGSASILHFAVSDGAGLYELAFNPARMRWMLAGVETH